jgi:hypothetical protein
MKVILPSLSKLACVSLILLASRGTLPAADSAAPNPPAAPPGAGQQEKRAGKPLFTVRTLYAPGHFGNSYEVMGQYEMRRLLAEAVHWGFNAYGDWFDMEDCSDPFRSPDTLGAAMWRAKKTNFRTAQSLGLACYLIITPNHVYVDQCLPELRAVKGGRIFGQLICPSKPKARAIILKNYQNLFTDLAAYGVHLSAICPCPYDFGGCACEKCKPWILTYARLVKDIHALAERYHPGVQLRSIGWWWTPEEHRLYAQWADRQMPGQEKMLFLHIPYGRTTVGDVVLPRGCQRGAFVHIGYAGINRSADIYGHLGPVIAADRLQRTVAHLSAKGVTGVMAYSEGVFDDVNKALLAGLGSGKFRTADEVLRAYAQRYFGADARSAARWARWLKAWESPFAVDTAKSKAELAELLKGAPPATWQRRQWELKQELFQWNRAVGSGDVWTPERLAAADAFWQVHEQIQRGLWGLALLRHGFGRQATGVPWQASWEKHMAQQRKRTAK